MKTRTSPLTSADGDEEHPAFGVISVHRISATPGEVLFASDLRHSEFIRVSVHEATRKRDLHHDWVHPGKMVCEVAMSMSQFASFVASSGTEGVPCTIEFTGSGESESGRRPARAGELTMKNQQGSANPWHCVCGYEEVRAAADEAYGHIAEAYEAYAATLEDSGKGSAAARRAALGRLSAAITNAAPNVAYAAKTLDRHAEEVVEQARGDIEAMAARAAQRLGIAPAGIQAIEAAGPPEQEN